MAVAVAKDMVGHVEEDLAVNQLQLVAVHSIHKK